MKSQAIETANCIYCGQATARRDLLLNPGAEHPLPCCSEACREKTQAFVSWDNKTRNVLYVVLFFLVLANLFFLGFNVQGRWQFAPMLGIALSVCAVPSVFARYERYQSLGIHRTRTLIRIITGALALFALYLTISY